jgi:general secretion pathway protein G
MKTKKGFTLVELLLVVLIISVLAAIVVPRISGASDGAKQAKCRANFTNIVKALEMYVATNGKYPVNIPDFEDNILKSKTYFPHGEPVCPFVGGKWVYKYSYIQPTKGYPYIYHSFDQHP